MTVDRCHLTESSQGSYVVRDEEGQFRHPAAVGRGRLVGAFQSKERGRHLRVNGHTHLVEKRSDLPLLHG